MKQVQEGVHSQKQGAIISQTCIKAALSNDVSKYLELVLFFTFSCFSDAGEQNMPPQDMLLWRIDYFEWQALEKQQLQKEAFFELPASA